MTNSRTASTLFSLVLIAVLAAAMVFFLGERTKTSSQTSVRITSPSEGALVAPGQTITVKLESSGSADLKLVVGGIVPYSSSAESLARADVFPFDLQLQVPESTLGPARIQVLAVDKNGTRFQASVGVTIKSDLLPQALVLLEEYRQVVLRDPNQSFQLLILADFPGGTRRDITRSPGTQYRVENTKVATVDQDGVVRARDLGRTVLTVSYASLSQVIPIRVGIFELPGDLDGDSDVDQDDLKIIQTALGTQATGPGDPRDLNSDGIINDLDYPLLIALCSRPDCLVSLGPSIGSVAFNGKKNMIIDGARFGSAPRVFINTVDKTDFVKTVSDAMIKLKGKAKKLGLKAGDNSVQVTDGTTGATSNVYTLKV